MDDERTLAALVRAALVWLDKSHTASLNSRKRYLMRPDTRTGEEEAERMDRNDGEFRTWLAYVERLCAPPVIIRAEEIQQPRGARPAEPVDDVDRKRARNERDRAARAKRKREREARINDGRPAGYRSTEARPSETRPAEAERPGRVVEVRATGQRRRGRPPKRPASVLAEDDKDPDRRAHAH